MSDWDITDEEAEALEAQEDDDGNIVKDDDTPAPPLKSFKLDVEKLSLDTKVAKAKAHLQELETALPGAATEEEQEAILEAYSETAFFLDQTEKSIPYAHLKDDESFTYEAENAAMAAEAIEVKIAQLKAQGYADESVTMTRARDELNDARIAKAGFSQEESRRASQRRAQDSIESQARAALKEKVLAERRAAIEAARAKGEEDWKIARLEAELQTPVQEDASYLKRFSEQYEETKAAFNAKVRQRQGYDSVLRSQLEVKKRVEAGPDSPVQFIKS